MANDDLNYSSQGFDSDVLDIIHREGVYDYFLKAFMIYEYMIGSEKFKERLPSKERFNS